MNLLFIFILALIIISLFDKFIGKKYLEDFTTRFSCQLYGDDYDSCYSDPSCTIGFLPNGDTHCMRKFIYEDI
jgi:hypothetical protein